MTSKSQGERRSSTRIAMSSEKPVYLQVELNNTTLGLFVEDLSVGGACLICPEENEAVSAGKHLVLCTLILPDVGRVALKAVVRWRVWPKLGVRFEELSENARQQIAQFLQASS